MKRFFCFLLVILLTFSLFSCGAKEPAAGETKGREDVSEDLTLLSPKERYQAGVKKTENLHAATYESTLSFEGEEKTVKTLRVRRGYDDFDYERRGEESLAVVDGKIYVSHPLGKFSAEVTTRGAREYLAQYWYPLTSLSVEDLDKFSGEGLEITYEIVTESVLKLYADAVSDPAFLPEKGTGKAILSSDGVIEKEVITVTGKGEGGVEKTLSLESVLTDRESALTVSVPSGRFTPVGDIRIPHLFTSSVAALEGSESLSATLMQAQSVTLPQGTASRAGVLHYFQTSPAVFYLAETKVEKVPSEAEQKSFSQILQKGGKRTSLEFFSETGEVIGEGEEDRSDPILSSLFEQYRLDISFLSDFSLSENSETVTVSFTFSEEGEEEIFKILRGLYPNPSSSTFPAPTVREGVFNVSKKTGRLTVFSAMLSGEGYSYSCSMTLDEEGGVTLPEWQEPAPEGEQNPAEGEHEH